MAPDARRAPFPEFSRPLPMLWGWRDVLLTAAGAVAAAAVARILLEQVVPGLLPFLLTFPAVIAATLLAGTAAGWIALAGCQLLTIGFVLPHWVRDSGDRPQELVNLALATASLALAVWATAAYRGTQMRLRGQCEREVRTLSLLVNEIDHRTKNNFQIAAALLHGQGAGAEPRVREELETAAARLISIAAIYGNLSTRRPDGDAVAVRAHLGEICDGLRAGLLPPGVTLAVTGAEATVPATLALTVGLVVNEWVTNAVKYAFPGGRGAVQVLVATHARELVVEVRDDGVGLPPDRSPGTGSRLLTSLVEAVGGRVDRQGTGDTGDTGGTVCTLRAPLPSA